jgi:hypothetical protein
MIVPGRIAIIGPLSAARVWSPPSVHRTKRGYPFSTTTWMGAMELEHQGDVTASW